MSNIVGVARHGYFGNIYSWGIDDLAGELNTSTPLGVHFTVSGGDDPRVDGDAFDDAMLEILAKGTPVVWVAHSLGADQALRWCRKANARGLRVPLVCPIDPVSWDSDANSFQAGRWEVDANVDRVVGFLSTSFPGEGRVFRAAGNDHTLISDTQLELPHAVPRGFGTDIASSPIVHRAIIEAVKDLVTQLVLK
jgi:hypothetical protein